MNLRDWIALISGIAGVLGLIPAYFFNRKTSSEPIFHNSPIHNQIVSGRNTIINIGGAQNINGRHKLFIYVSSFFFFISFLMLLINWTHKDSISASNQKFTIDFDKTNDGKWRIDVFPETETPPFHFDVTLRQGDVHCSLQIPKDFKFGNSKVLVFDEQNVVRYTFIKNYPNDAEPL